MFHEGFTAMWNDGWRGKAGAIGLLVALASAMGWVAEKHWRMKRRREDGR